MATWRILDLMSRHNRKLYALAIIAHPDDESFLFAGTIMKFKDKGKEVGVICATRGEKGADRLNRKFTPNQMAKIRTKELKQACDLLHCQCRRLFEFHDGGLDETDFEKLVSELTDEINSCQPQIVLTFGEEGISGHKDHITIGRAAIEACKQADPRPSEIWQASIPASMAEDFHNHTEKRKVHHLHYIKNHLQGVLDEKLKKVDVKKYQDQKLNAIQAHQSQYLPQLVWPHFLENEWFEVIKLP